MYSRTLAGAAARSGVRHQSTANSLPNWFGVRINGKKVLVHPKATVLQACEEAGVDVPRFCYHEHLSVAGNCRMCLVEIAKSPKPVASCAMPVANGMNIWTDTPLVKKAREAVVEMLLVNHPLDCPICDQGGECDLQDLTMAYGSDRGRFYEFKRSVEDKEVGPVIKTIMTRCIHCTRCVRFSAEVAGTESMGAFGRGTDTEIGTYVQSFVRSELSGNLVDVCPVGALTSKPYAMQARPWELQRTESVDVLGDALASDISVETRLGTGTPSTDGPAGASVASGERILRVQPRKGLYPEPWISDKARFAFDGLKSRFPTPWRNDANGGTGAMTWLDALYDAAFRLERNTLQRAHPEAMPWHAGSPGSEDASSTLAGELLPSRTGAVFGPSAELEGMFALSTFVKLLGGSELQQGAARGPSALNGDAPFFFTLNRLLAAPAPGEAPGASALELQYPRFLPSVSTMLVIGANTRLEAPLLHVLLRKALGRHAITGLAAKRAAGVAHLTSIGAYAPLALPAHDHAGSGARALLAFAENRTPAATAYYRQKGASVLLGAGAAGGPSGGFTQNVARFIGRKFVAKTRSGERFGVLHGSVGSVNAAALGVAPGVRSPLHLRGRTDAQISTLFAVQTPTLPAARWSSPSTYTKTYALATHKDLPYKYDAFLPVRSAYESDGHVVSAEGRVRRFRTAVTPAPDARSVDVFVFALSKMVGDWFGSLEALWSKGAEVPTDASEPGHLVDAAPAPFPLNPWGYAEPQARAPLFTFPAPVASFYTGGDLLAARSRTMGECALFLERDSNFVGNVE